MPLAECIGYSEIDRPAIKTYEEHFEHKNYGDITTITPSELPEFDLVVGGFPCQAFSIAGHRKGFDDTRGTLFFDIARILAEKRPRHLVLENVKGLLSHDGGKTIQTILGVLSDLGYFVEWQVLNSKNHGVPQKRERIYIIGHLGGLCGRQVFPIGGDVGTHNSPGVTEPQGAQVFIKTRHLSQNGGLISNNTTLQASEIPHIIDAGFMQRPARVYTETAPTVRDYGSGGNKMPMVYNRRDGLGKELDVALTLSSSDYRGLNRNQNQTAVVSIDYKNPSSKTRRGRVKDGYVGTLDTDVKTGVLDSSYIRRLTPTECERLQGFPDHWTIGSNTQRYKQLGNAVTVNVVQDVIASIRDNCGL